MNDKIENELDADKIIRLEKRRAELVEMYNKLVGRFNTLDADNDSLIDKYNALVNDHNKVMAGVDSMESFLIDANDAIRRRR